MMEEESVEALWQNYRFLTKEMLKFLIQHDLELFYELMDQRERLQNRIDQISDKVYLTSLEGRSLLAQIAQDNEEITHNLQFQYSRVKRYHQVSEVYTHIGTVTVSRRNWER